MNRLLTLSSQSNYRIIKKSRAERTKNIKNEISKSQRDHVENNIVEKYSKPG